MISRFRSRLSAEQVSLGFGLIWGAAISVLSLPWDAGAQSWYRRELLLGIWAIAAGAVIGVGIGKLVYRSSELAYTQSAWWLLLWAPFTLCLSGALFGLVWGSVGLGIASGGPAVGIYGAYYGALWALPTPERDALWVIAFQGAALATHLIVRRVHCSEPKADVPSAPNHGPSGKAWVPWLASLLPGMALGVHFAAQQPLFTGVAIFVWCTAVSLGVYLLSRHTYRHDLIVQVYWAPFSMLIFLGLIGLPIAGLGVFEGAMSSLVAPRAMMAAYFMQFTLRWLERRFGSPATPDGVSKA